jgi:N-acetylneuraminic acid mutarotase
MTCIQSATTIARAGSGPRAEEKVMNAQKLAQQLLTAVRILVWTGLLAVYAAPCRADSWTSLDPMPTARSGLAVAAVTAKDSNGNVIVDSNGNAIVYVYAFGGSDLTDALDTVEVYNTATNKWSSMSPVTGEPLPHMPTARLNFAAATDLDGTIYVLGGINDDGVPFASVDAYNPYTNTWTTVASMLVPRMNLAAATDADGRIYALGGANYQSGHLATAEIYYPTSDTWESIASMSTKRNYPAAVSLAGTIYVLAGVNLDAGNLTSMEVYDPVADAWSLVASMPRSRSNLAAAVGSDGRIYALGGLAYDPFEGHFIALDRVEAYDPSTNTWSTSTDPTGPPPMPTARASLAAASESSGRIYAVGGDNGRQPLSAAEVYGP